MTNVFNANSARELMRKVAENPIYLDALVRIKSAARCGFSTVTIDVVSPLIELELRMLGFAVESYVSTTGGSYTKIDWSDNG